MTSSTTPALPGELQSFRHLAMLADRVLRANLAGVTHEESLVQPQPAGNCLNWVVGHLVNIYNSSLPLFGQERVIDPEALKVYDRGAPPLTDPAAATDLHRLVALWEEIAARVDAGIGSLSVEGLDHPAPFSPSGNPDETVRSLIATVLFHQAYHAGQTGVLRRIAGREGVIK